MPLGRIAHLFFPYCLDRQADGSYVILNRNYKPVGLTVPRFPEIAYGDFPVSVRFASLREQTARRLSHKGSPDLQRIFLYDDSCIPTATPGDMAAYLQRLDILMSLKFKGG